MDRMSQARLLLVVVAVILPATCFADEEMEPLAVSGVWAAMAHRPDMTAHPDVCVAMAPESGIAFRASADDGLQIRVINRKWSLPTDIHGDIKVSVGDVTQAFPIDDNTDTMVDAPIDDQVGIDLFNAMDKASSMTITIGKDKPIAVSLSGSAKVTNAFRTCAGIKGNSASPGSNPFE